MPNSTAKDGKKFKPTVLIVDDEPDLRDLLISAFRDAGCETLEAENGVQAFGMVTKLKPDAVVSDVRMRGGGGLELLAKCKKQDPQLPVFLISGFSDTSPSQASQLGADLLFVKPFSPDQVAVKVIDFIRLSKAAA